MGGKNVNISKSFQFCRKSDRKLKQRSFEMKNYLVLFSPKLVLQNDRRQLQYR